MQNSNPFAQMHGGSPADIDPIFKMFFGGGFPGMPGMTGGVAFVYDKESKLNESINQSSVELMKIQDTDKTIVNYFKKIMRDYIKETKSINAKYIMKNISEEFKYIKLVKPINSSMEDIKKNSINKVA